MSKTFQTLAALTLVSLTSLGCSSSKSSTADAPQSARAGKLQPTTFPVPAESKFAQLRYGMGTAEVEDIVGPPTDADHRITGKVFNPFYYGTDTNRQTWFYKGEGRLVFNSRGRLIGARYDSGDRGYR